MNPALDELIRSTMMKLARLEHEIELLKGGDLAKAGGQTFAQRVNALAAKIAAIDAPARSAHHNARWR